MPPNAAGQLPASFSKTAGPFIGVRDSLELSAQDMRRAIAIVNGIIPVPEIGTDIYQRPGVAQQGISGAGVSVNGPIRGMYGFIGPDGVYNNLLLTHNTGLNAYFSPNGGTDRYTPINYMPPSTYAAWMAGSTQVIADPTVVTNRVFFATLGNYLLVQSSNGNVFKMVANTSTHTVSALTDLSSTNVVGRPTIYYGKFFTTLASDMATIVWSEENDPDTGYEATGFANAWTLRQTSNAPIMGLCGTNQALYVFRNNSITEITGPVETDFVSSGTLEGISTKVGCLAPDSICLVENTVWFLDQFCRPQKIQTGTGLIPLWYNCRRQCALADMTAATQYGNWGRYLPDSEVVIFRVAQASGNPALLVFSSRTQEYLGTWSISGFGGLDYGATFYDAAKRETLAVSMDTTSNPLQFAMQLSLSATDQRDVLVAGTASPAVSVTTPLMQADIDMEVLVDTMTVTGQIAPNGTVPSLLAAFASSNAALGSPIALANTQSADTVQRYTVQPNVNGGRWLQVQLTNDVAVNATPIIGQVRVAGTQQRADYSTP